MKKLLLPLLLVLASCSNFIDTIDKTSVPKAAQEKKFSLLFSHNISGETHPCGCRNFPLGGLPQVAGLFAKISNDSELLYVDTGDTFFPSSVVPVSMKDSLTFAANNLAVGLDQIGLKYFVPGDQDFAMGVEFLQGVANSRKFEFLIGNLSDPTLLKHKKFAIIDRNKTKIFLVGLVDPETFNGPAANYFTKPADALPGIIVEITKAGYDKNNEFHRLVILSHAGIDPDEQLAKQFPNIDWIIGSHSQSFLRYSKDEGNTKMVQTLSKNHYIGDIKIDLNSKKQTDTYELHEVRDELERNLEPNPMRAFIDDHKSKMNDLQIKEQAKMGMSETLHESENAKVVKFKTAASYLETHKKQAEFWQGTPHAIAYTTLIKVNEANNLSCIGCHSLGLNDPRGYTTQKNMVTFKGAPMKGYWDDVKKMSAHIESVRKADPAAVKKVSVQWFALDKKAGVKSNFANVQCLSCHAATELSPVKDAKPLAKKDIEFNIKNKCLSCHTPDQSPEWYESGLKVTAKFQESYKKVSCPR